MTGAGSGWSVATLVPVAFQFTLHSHWARAAAMSDRTRLPSRECTHASTRSSQFTLPEGDLLDLLSSQQADVVNEVTFQFCDRFVRRAEDTFARMVRTARTTRRKVAKASAASAESKPAGLELARAARNGLDALLSDYRDILRTRRFRHWERDSPEARYVVGLFQTEPARYETWRKLVESRSDEDVANIAICLIDQTGVLLDQQIHRLEQDVVEERTRERLQKQRQPPARFQPRQRPKRSGR